MSNIFQPLVRSTGGVVPFNIGTGALGTVVKNQHLNLDESGAVYASIEGVINHYGAGLPFDINGRLVIARSEYRFNGIDQYATMSSWSPLGAGVQVSYETDNEDGRIIDSSYPVSEIGRVSGLVHSGTISNLKLTDLSPLQNRYAVSGNGVNLYGEIPEVTLGGDFEIEFDFIYDVSGNDGMVFGGDTTKNGIETYHTGTDTLSFFHNGDLKITGTTVLNVGQHYKIHISRVGSNTDLMIDGVSQGVVSTVIGNGIISHVCVRNNGGSLLLYSSNTLANLRITDKSSAEDVVYFYPMDEASGDLFLNTDSVTGGVSTQGTWNNLTSERSLLPGNSRHYPMNEGTGAVFADRLGDGSTDATIVNHNETSWEPSASEVAPVRTDQSVKYADSGALAVGGEIAYYSQGVAYAADGALAQ